MAIVITNLAILDTLVKGIESVLRFARPCSREENHLAAICNIETHITKKERLEQAVRYARTTMLNPAEKQFYATMARRLKCTNAFNAAVKDYMADPQIRKIVLSEYSGEKRERIFVEIDDYLKIDIVIIEILSAEGTLLESGTATRRAGETTWKYLTTCANPSIGGTRVKAIAIDRPGKEATMEVMVK